ncbi:MAG: metallophosphoesterase family protein [Candidatus Hydrogenedentota bacterium]
MRYAIISDIHANLEALEAVLARIAEMGVDQIVCLGDVVGYNASPNACVDIIRDREIPTIMGNHDAVACLLEEPWGFNPVAMQAAMWTREQLSDDNLAWIQQLPMHVFTDDFVGVHGAPGDRDMYLFSWEDILPHVAFLDEVDRRICMFGHTHMPGIFSSDGAYSPEDDNRFQLDEDKPFFINPGSVGQPRDGNSRAAFGLYDSDEHVFEQVRLTYPVAEAAQRVTDAGLPEFLADRLGLGR